MICKVYIIKQTMNVCLKVAYSLKPQSVRLKKCHVNASLLAVLPTFLKNNGRLLYSKNQVTQTLAADISMKKDDN